MQIIAVDWGKDSRKRAAFRFDPDSRVVSKFSFDGSLESLLRYASATAGPVLIGIDAAIGCPAKTWADLRATEGVSSESFIDFLLGDEVPADYFDPVPTPELWRPDRPFIRPPPGKWSRRAFEAASKDGIRRDVDRKLNANPIFVTAGIPGSVGAGTRALWQELRASSRTAEFTVWPFHGRLEALVRSNYPVVAEIYPKACYGLALAPELPARLEAIAKTKRDPRDRALDRLLGQPWLETAGITIQDVHFARDNEDDFDALFSAVALARLMVEGVAFDDAASIDRTAEGGVLGASSVDLDRDRAPRRAGPPRPAREMHIVGTAPATAPREELGDAVTYPCPIDGCDHVFRGSRGGWDAHVGSVRRHPRWHPEESDPERRRTLFRAAFPQWFRRS